MVKAKWLESMNPEQTQAILHQDGPVAVLAQAGSGKTRALVHRIARMVDDGVPPSQILAVTFSKKAADEMNARLEHLGVLDARVGTWHSLCLQILKEDRTPWGDWDIDDTDRAKFVMKDVLGYKGMKWDTADLTLVRSFVGWCKAHLWEPDSKEAHDRAVEVFNHDAARAVQAYARFQVEVEDRALLTFDDFLVFAHRHLSDETHRRAWAGKWTYVLQDEAQDANWAQCAIAILLAKDHRNYMVVGDIAQSIFGFRGSSPTYLARFVEEWGAKRIAMRRNYRSGRRIVDAANGIIRPAALRLPEDMLAERDIEGDVKVVASPNFDGEASSFVAWVRELVVQRSAKLSDITAIFRTNAQSRALEEALLSARIPYVVVGGTSFYERKEVKDLLAYLRVATGRDRDGDAVARCINAPFRFLGKAFVERLTNQTKGLKDPDWGAEVLAVASQAGIQSRQRQSASDWAALVRAVAGAVSAGDRPSQVLHSLVQTTRYIEWLQKEEGEESLESSHAANVRELVRVAERFETVPSLLDFIDETMRAARQQRVDKQAGGERVLLMSIHRSKGLEWPYLWVSGVNEAILPHRRGDPEEERRLAYVAATRARDELVLSYVLQFASPAGIVDAVPSRFIADAGLDVSPLTPVLVPPSPLGHVTIASA